MTAASGTLHTKHVRVSRRIACYVAKYGMPPTEDEVTRGKILLMCPEDSRTVVNAAMLNPGSGLQGLIDSLSEGMPASLLRELSLTYDEIEGSSDAWTGLLTELTSISQKRKFVDDLVSCVASMEAGNAVMEDDALQRVSQLAEHPLVAHSGDELDIATLTLPSASGLHLNLVDRSTVRRAFTALEAWAVVAPGELGVIIGGPGSGKSTALVFQGSGYALHNDGLVIHFSEELSLPMVYSKYASCILQTPLEKLRATTEDKLSKRLSNAMEGAVSIESHSSGSSTPRFLAERAKKILKDSGRERIECILVDYAALLRPNSGARGNRYEDLNEIIVSLRAMANDLQCPVWTAAQPRRAPAVSMSDYVKLANFEPPVFGLEDMAECWAIGFVADYVLSLNQTDQEKQVAPVPEARLHRAKVRIPSEDAEARFTKRVQVSYGTCTIG